MLAHRHTRAAIVIDPGQAEPVLQRLQETGYRLIGILITHHHWDHTGGVEKLVEETQASVYGSPHDPIPRLTYPLTEYQQLPFPDLHLTLTVLYTPGHTHGHIAYLGANRLFCGDTLFTAGCGRIFEGTAAQMFNSIQLLKSLNDSTQLYCGHEYTLSNLYFARRVEPDNLDIQKRIKTVQQLRKRKQATVPAPLSIELKTNPFLRTDVPQVAESLFHHFQQRYSSELEIFTQLRLWKDSIH